jgi:hypothetical protein
MPAAHFPIRLRVLAIGVLVAVLADCNGAGAQSPVASFSPAGIAPKSLAPAAVADFMYVVDNGSQTVYQYSYQTRKRLGKLKGPFYDVLTMCVDTAQDVFVVDDANQSIREYSHDGERLISTVIDLSGFPTGCSVDRTTGNLAVTNYLNAAAMYPGNVVIYPHVTGNPKTYDILNIYEVYFPAYDDKGNLFVDGYSLRYGAPLLSELPKGGNSFKDLRMNVRIPSIFGMQWDGKYLAICDTAVQPNKIDRFSISRSGAQKVSSTALKDDDDVYQFFIATIGGKTMLIATDRRHRKVSAWRYPLGGSPAFSIGGFSRPLDAAVSL